MPLRGLRDLRDASEGGRKKYYLRTAIAALIAHERRTAGERSSAGVTKGSGKIDSLASERMKLTRARRKRIEHDNAVAAGKYAEVKLVGVILRQEFMVIRELFLALPGKEADSLSFGDANKRSAIELHLRDAVYEILNNLADPKQIAARAAANLQALQRGGVTSSDEDADDAPTLRTDEAAE